jgi:hypothetical protein
VLPEGPRCEESVQIVGLVVAELGQRPHPDPGQPTAETRPRPEDVVDPPGGGTQRHRSLCQGEGAVQRDTPRLREVVERVPQWERGVP